MTPDVSARNRNMRKMMSLNCSICLMPIFGVGKVYRIWTPKGGPPQYCVIIIAKEETGDSEQTPGGIARAAPNAKRSRQLLLAKKHGLRSDRNYYMPSNLADAMIRLFDGSSNEGLTTLSQILRRGQHTLGQLWTNQLSPQSTEDLKATNAVLPGLSTI